MSTALACSYGYLGAPTVTGVNPNHGSTLGGDAVVISGCGFTGATAVKFGTTAAAAFTVVNDSTINATTPAHTAGAVDVTVTTPSGTSATSTADQFTFGAAPCTGATATVSFSGVVTSGAAGNDYQINATAMGCTHPLFEYFVMNPGGAWTVIQPFASRNFSNWDTGANMGPEPAGTYFYSVWVRDASSTGVNNGGANGNYDAFAPGKAFPLTSSPCTAVTANAVPSSPQGEGTTVTITANGTCPNGALFEFWLLPPGSTTWEIAQGYSFNNQFIWFTGGQNGTYKWSVWVRDTSSAGVHPQFLSSYDAFQGGQGYVLT